MTGSAVTDTKRLLGKRWVTEGGGEFRAKLFEVYDRYCIMCMIDDR